MTGKPEPGTNGTSANGTSATSANGAELRDLGFATMRSILRGGTPESHLEEGAYVADLRDGKLGEDIVEIGLVGVWASLWAREGLSRRDRSLVTLGILIALGAEEEMRVHVKMGLRNGLTREEIGEVIYHAAGYAGYPRAMAARKAAREAIGEQ